MNTKKITDCERLVMMVIWDASKDLSMQEIHNEVNKRYNKSRTIQTVSTFLKRLREKHYLTMHRKGHVFYYTPLVTKQEYIDKLLKLLGISREDILSSNW